MDSIVILSDGDKAYLAEAVTRAMAENRGFYICTGSSSNGAWLKFKVGGGMWTSPLYSIE